MAVEIDTSGWSGDGEFTQVLIDSISTFGRIASLRVEDAPSGRAEASYNFISNEIFVRFREPESRGWAKCWQRLRPARGVSPEGAMTLVELETELGQVPAVGVPDYADEGMLQYLRARRIVPPYQTRGYKLVELVRIYVAGRQGAS